MNNKIYNQCKKEGDKKGAKGQHQRINNTQKKQVSKYQNENGIKI